MLCLRLADMRLAVRRIGNRALHNTVGLVEVDTSIENGLKSKYGDTKYNSSTLLTIPYESIPVDRFQRSTRHAYSQRLIETGTNEYVFIDHYIYEYKLYSDYSKYYYYSISDRVDYPYLDATSAQNLFDKLNQQQNDL